MTTVDTQIHPADLDTGQDHLSHRFCRDQANAWLNGDPATARCGKTKPDWERADGNDLLCTICWHYWQNKQCEHCSNLTRGGN